jgi:hypothetical protein
MRLTHPLAGSLVVSDSSSASVAVRHQRRGCFGLRATMPAAGNSSLRLGELEGAAPAGPAFGFVAKRPFGQATFATESERALARFPRSWEWSAVSCLLACRVSRLFADRRVG